MIQWACVWMRVCVSVCVCIEPEAILSNSGGEGSRECVPTKPTPEPTQHTPHSHGETHDHVCMHILAWTCISSVFTHARVVHQHRADGVRKMYLFDHPVFLLSWLAEISCVFLFIYLFFFFSLQLSTENREVWEESLRCLSLLVGLYGGQGEDCLSRSCLQSFIHVLRTHTQNETTHSALEIINRLVNIHRKHT